MIHSALRDTHLTCDRNRPRRVTTLMPSILTSALELRAARRLARVVCMAASCVLAFGNCSDPPAPPPSGPLTIVSGGSGNDTISTALPNPLVVEARDMDGQPSVGVEVSFRAFRVGPDSIVRVPLSISKSAERSYALAVSDTTDSTGRASVFVTLTPFAGEGKIVVTVPALAAQTTAWFTTRPGAVVRTEIAPADTPIVVGRSYQIRANLVDRYDNVVRSASASFARMAGPITVSAQGIVQGTGIGRGEIGASIGTRVDRLFASVVPDATIAVREFGSSSGDTLGFLQVKLDGSNRRWIAVTGVTPSEYGPSNRPAPQWIPGARQLVYPQDVDERPRLFVGDSTGASRRLIEASYGVTRETDPDVSSDGQWVYFVGHDTTGIDGIRRVSIDGGTPLRVALSIEFTEVLWPSVSPDGTRLVFVARLPGWPTLFPYVHDLRTGVTSQLSPNEAAGTVWSPNGEWILYAISGPHAGYSGHLRLVRSDGTEDRPVDEGAAYYPGGTWSPNGRYVIAVRAAPEPRGPQLIDVTTGMRLPLVFVRDWYAPRWRR